MLTEHSAHTLVPNLHLTIITPHNEMELLSP